MRYNNFILIMIAVLSVSVVWCQKTDSLASGLYSVDPQIKTWQQKFEFIDTGVLKRALKIRVFQNKHLFFNNYEDKAAIDCYTTSFLKDDTLVIIGYMSYGWYGFRLVLYKDSYIIASFALSDGDIYKYRLSDAEYKNVIFLPSSSYKVVLSKKPVYKESEVISGYVQLKSEPFYYKGFEEKFIIEIVANFKTAPVGNRDQLSFP